MRRSSFIFKENHVFFEEKVNPSDKVVMVEEELDGTHRDNTGNLVDLPGLMLIVEECGDFKVVVDNGERTINNNRKKSSEVKEAQTYRC